MKAYYLLLITMLFTVGQAFAQTKPSVKLSDFEILVENTDDGLKLISRGGSAWTELTFSLREGDEQAVDEYGMTEIGKVTSKENSDLSNFLFTVTKKDEKVVLKGIEGTSWIELFFTLREDHKVTIDQHGYDRRVK